MTASVINVPFSTERGEVIADIAFYSQPWFWDVVKQVLGSLVWLWLVLLPMVVPARPPYANPEDLHWLAMFSLRLQPGHIAISMGASLAVNLVTVVLVSRAVRPSMPRQTDAVAADTPALAAAAGGARVKVVAASVSSPKGVAILVPAGSPIRTVADLKGRNVIVSSARA